MLFAPADRPERFAKAAARSDVVILDLEDGAGRDSFDEARTNIVNSDLDPATTIVRVHSADSELFDGDIDMVTKTPYTTVMVPKVDQPLPDTLADYDVIAMLESPSGIMNARDIAHQEFVVGLLWGAEDFTASLGGVYSRLQRDERGWDSDRGSAEGPYRTTVNYLRTQTLLHAAEAGIVALDAVFADIHDADGLRDEALDAARIGFAATACIHPAQVPVIRDAYRPSEEQVKMARRIVRESADHPGALNIDGKMVDAPLFRQAEVLAARADALGM
ncbi:CoA ester lyase [Corynebacterium parakroppenstedtii]|nr:CoA ester lyase [Corynebacterium parakroppenstedtii]MBY0792975.1 CoA ester lyase [Corynebacterium parakroppenstedtii]MBY0797763.1 CoA ester lyase [Corynebacterium parakroppenstedtii]PMC67571.1 CoA ester lyase [Corynebacterium kroppenstedtii]